MDVNAYVETAALFAVLEGNTRKARDLVESMLPSELHVFDYSIDQLRAIVADAIARQV